MSANKVVGLSEEGFPRQKAPWRNPDGLPARCPELPERLPVPWINGPCIERSSEALRASAWTEFREDGSRAHYERLCFFCGQPLGSRILLGAFGISIGGRPLTSGPGGHPRCIRIAIECCPHLVELRNHGPETIVAYEYVGPGTGYEVDPEYKDFREWINAEGWGSGEKIDLSARPLTSSQVADIAKKDPLGELPCANVGTEVAQN